MQLFNELVNIITIIILSYAIVRIKQKNLKSKTSSVLLYTMVIFVILTALDVINTFFIKNMTLDLSIVILKLPLVVILITIFFKLRRKGSL